jgi:nucleotide-binding universal stress UspA family protein
VEVEMAKEDRASRLIVVGVDGSPEAGKALDWAVDLARALQAEVVAVHSLEVPFAAHYPL